jgi:hypothetical protein
MQNIRKYFHHQQQSHGRQHKHKSNDKEPFDSKQKAKMERELQECLAKIQTME